MRRWINISYKYVKKLNDIVKENLQKKQNSEKRKEVFNMDENDRSLNMGTKSECPHCSSTKKEKKESNLDKAMKDKSLEKPTACCCPKAEKEEKDISSAEAELKSAEQDAGLEYNAETAKKSCCCSHKAESQAYTSKEKAEKETDDVKNVCPHCASENKRTDRASAGATPVYGCCSVPKKETGCGCGTVKKAKSLKQEIITQCVLLAVSLVFLIAGFFDWKHIWIGFYYFNPAWIALLICGVPIFISAVKLLSKGKIKANTLISIAMLACVALEIAGFFVDTESGLSHNHSYVFAAAEIAFLMSLGSFIEDLTVKKCRSGIEKVVNLLPKDAFVLVDGEWVNTPTDKIKAGDMILVKSGEVIAVDGIVKKGSASIDQSSVTGEYLPF